MCLLTPACSAYLTSCWVPRFYFWQASHPSSSLFPSSGLPLSLVAHTAAGLIWKRQHLLSHSPAQACQWLPTSWSLKYKCLRAATGLNIPSVCLPPPPSLSPSQTRPVPTPQMVPLFPARLPPDCSVMHPPRLSSAHGAFPGPAEQLPSTSLRWLQGCFPAELVCLSGLPPDGGLLEGRGCLFPLCAPYSSFHR